MRLIAILLTSITLCGCSVRYIPDIASEVVNVVSSRPFKASIDTTNARSGYGDATISPTDLHGWTDYIRANERRIQGWVADPPDDAFFAGQVVSITFSRPANLDEFHRAVDPLLGDDGTFEWYLAVGRRHDGRWGGEWTARMPDESLFVERIPPPLPDGSEHRYVIDGIMQAVLRLGSHGVSAETLAAVDELDFVYLVDATPILVAKETWVELEWVSVRSPYDTLLPEAQ